MKKILLFLVFFTASVCSAAKVPNENTCEIFISEDGSDSHSGSADSPVATIPKAQSLVRKAIRQDKYNFIKVYFRRGTYNITEPIELDIEDSGSETLRIEFLGYPGEEAVISGGKKITGWEKNKDGTWTAEISAVKAGETEFNELFRNGKRLTRARYPNEGYLRVVKSVNKTSSFVFVEGDISKPEDWENIILTFIHDWSLGRSPIKSIDTEKNIVTTEKDIAFNTWWACIGRIPDEPYYLENSITFLDQPGEWHLDTVTGVLTYMPAEGETIEGSEFVVPVSEGLVTAQGDADSNEYLQNIHFKNLTFRYAAWVPENRHFLEMQAGYHGNHGNVLGGDSTETTDEDKTEWKRMPAAIKFDLARNCSITDCRIAHIGKTAIDFNRSCFNNIIAGNHIYDIAGTGIMIGEGNKDRIIDNKVWWLVKPEQASAYNTVKNNLIETCGQNYWGSVAVWIGLSNHNLVSRNTIRNLPYTGISTSWMWSRKATPCHHNVIEYNHIYNTLIKLTDGAAIYTLGRQDGTTLRGNHIHDVVETKAKAPNNALRWDRGGSEMQVDHNLAYNVHDSMMHFNPDTCNNIIEKNYFVLKPDQELASYNKVKEKYKDTIKIENNTLMKAKQDRQKLKKLIKEFENYAGVEYPYKKKFGL